MKSLSPLGYVSLNRKGLYINKKWGLYDYQKQDVRELILAQSAILTEPIGSGKCLEESVRVPTSLGVLPIGELHSRFVVGERFTVWSEEGEKPVTGVLDNGLQDLVLVKTKDGRRIAGTGEHRLRVWVGGRVEWKKLQDLVEGDVLLVSHVGGCDSPSLTFNFYMLGVIAGDGYLNKTGRVNVCVGLVDYKNETEYISEINSWFDSVLGGGNWVGQKSCWVKSKCGGDLGRILLAELYSGALKVVPEMVFRSSLVNRVSFLSGLVDTDGHVGKKGGIEIATKSEKFMLGLVSLLNSLSVSFRVRRSIVKGKFYHRITITRRESYLRLAELGFSLKIRRKQSSFDKFLNGVFSFNDRMIIPNSNSLGREIYRKVREKYGRMKGKRCWNLFGSCSAGNCQNIAIQTLRRIESSFPGCIPLEGEYLMNHSCSFDLVEDVAEGKGKTYELSVQDSPTYIVEGFISHNTVISMAFLDVLWRLGKASKVLVVAPNSIIPQWGTMIRKWLGVEPFPVLGGKGLKNRIYQYNTFKGSLHYDIMLINYSTVVSDLKELAQLGFSVVLFDEASALKGRNTATTKACRILASFMPYKVLITGTPIQNHLLEFFSLLEFVAPRGSMNFDYFKARYCIEEVQEVNTFRGPVRFKKIVGYKNLEEVKVLVKKYCIRNGVNEVRGKMPRVVAETRYVDLTEEQAKRYREIKAGVLEVDGICRRVDILERMIRLQQTCDSLKCFGEKEDDSAKLDEVERLLLGELRGTKTIVYFLYKIPLFSLKQRLEAKGIEVVTITGDATVPQRESACVAFNEGSADVLLMTDAGGIGLNLQGGSCLIMMDRDWNPAVNQQVIGRINRVGQLAPVVAVLNIVARETIDEYVFKILTDKVGLQNELFADVNINALGVDTLKCLITGMGA